MNLLSTTRCVASCTCWQRKSTGRGWLPRNPAAHSSRQLTAQHSHSRPARCLTLASKQEASSSEQLRPSDPASQPLDVDENEAGEDEDGDFEDEFLGDTAGEAEEESVLPETSTGGAAWGEQALAVAEQVLATTPELAGVSIFSFRVQQGRKHLDIRLDKLEDYWGSPTLDEIERFSRTYSSALEAAIGADLAGGIDYEVSSPGAERLLRLPGDLQRFQHLAMKVVYTTAEGKQDLKILEFVEVRGMDAALQESSAAGSDALTVWRLADVRANAPQKGRKLSKKQRELGYQIKLSDIKQVNLYVDC